MKYFALLTKLGENLLAQATALGTKLELTHMAVGDGGGKLPTPDTNQTKLIAEKRRAAINTLFIDDKNKNQIIAEQIIPEQDGGWWIREIGLFDKAGNLIAVANCPETYKPQLAEGSGRTQSIRIVLIVSHTESVTLKIDPSVVLATRRYVDDLITALDIKLQKQVDNKVNKDGDNVTGTLNFAGIAPLSYDLENLTSNKTEIANYLRKFRYLYNSVIFHEIVTKDGIQIATGVEPTNIIYSLSSNGSIKVSGRVIPMDFLDFNQRYLGINNPAISAKKLDKPSRIAGHAFQGQGEDIKITPADIGAQPTGDYATNPALKNGLDGKFDKTGGSLTGYLSAQKEVSSNFDGSLLSLITSDKSRGPHIAARRDANRAVTRHNMPEKSGKLAQIGDGGIVSTESYKDANSIEVTTFAASDVDSKNFFALYQPAISVKRKGGSTGTGFILQIQGDGYNEIAYRQRTNDVWRGWYKFLTEANTTKDANGFVRTGTATALITSQVAQGTGSSTNNVMSQKAITAAIAAVKTLGDRQKWTDVKAQRQSGVTYTNTTGRAIALSVSTIGAHASSHVDIYVDNVLCSRNNIGGNANAEFTRHSIGYAIIPTGSSYRVAASSLASWTELR